MYDIQNYDMSVAYVYKNMYIMDNLAEKQQFLHVSWSRHYSKSWT